MKTFSKIQIISDLDNIIPYLEEVHPNPFTCITKNEFAEKIELVKNNIFDNMTLLDFYFLAAPIVSSLKDGHTGISFPVEYFKELNPLIFPIKVDFKNNKLLVREKQTIPFGAEILSINNKNINQIIKNLLPLISGENDSFRFILFSGMFNSLFEYKDSYSIDYFYNNERKQVNLKGIKFPELIKNKEQKSKGKTENYSYKFTSNNIAIFDFKAFVDNEKFVPFLKEMFQKIKDRGVQNLIIDIRKNGGGNSQLTTELMQYISKTPFQQFGKTIVKYSGKRKEFYDNVMRNDILSYMTDKEYQELFKHKIGSIDIEKEGELIKLKDNKLRFSGNVYLLTSNYSFSSATDLAYTFQNFKVGKIIGEKTGGNIVTFGDIIYTYLPETNTKLYISHKEFYGYKATEKDRRPVKPDYEVESKKALEFALNLIDNTKEYNVN